MPTMAFVCAHVLLPGNGVVTVVVVVTTIWPSKGPVKVFGVIRDEPGEPDEPDDSFDDASTPPAIPAPAPPAIPTTARWDNPPPLALAAPVPEAIDAASAAVTTVVCAIEIAAVCP